MKVVCLKNYLKEALFFAERNSAKTVNMPILQGVSLKTDKGLLKITSTNLETAYETKITAKVQKEGGVVVPVRIFAQLVANFPDEKITLEAVNNNLSVSTDRVTSLIKGYPAEDFPRLPKIKDSHTLNIKRADLVNGLKRVQNAVSSSNIKPEISSIFFNTQNKSILKIAATDSFRLAEAATSYDLKNSIPFLLPHKSAIELYRLLESGDGDIKISSDGNQIVFTSDNFQFTSRLTDGVFPSYESIIPKKHTTEVVVDKTKLIDALRAASIFSGNLNEVNLHVISEDNLVEIKTRYSEIGEHVSQIPAEVSGEKISLNFNHNYLLDGLQNVDSQSVILRFSGENKPLLIQKPKDSSYLYLVMPMKNA